MRIIAHRGWSEIAPENSHEAFAAALTAPCDGIEMDLRLSADGVVVVCHDADLSRFGGSRVPISRRTADDLGLPTLAEVLERYGSVELFLELKPHGGPAHTARLVAAVCRLIPASGCRVLCFNQSVLRAVRQHRRDLPLVRNIERIPLNFQRFFTEMVRDGITAVDCDHHRWSAPAVAAAKTAGLVTATYTVNHATDLRRCQRLGIDEIITNRPRWAGGLIHGR